MKPERAGIDFPAEGTDAARWLAQYREVNGSCPTQLKDALIAYMKKGRTLYACPAIVSDLFNPQQTIHGVYTYTDERWNWQTFDIYYLERYDILPRAEFISDVASRGFRTPGQRRTPWAWLVAAFNKRKRDSL